MNIDISRQLARERRARLAAERLLEQRQTDLRKANATLERQARSLASSLVAQRDQAHAARDQSAALRLGASRARAEAERASLATTMAEQRLWQALQSVRDGFALFDAERRLVVANRAYLGAFDGLDCVKPGIHYDEICEILLTEGLVNPDGSPEGFLAEMRARWDMNPAPPKVLHFWNGQFIKVVDRATPEGGRVTLGINQTEMMRICAAIETIPDGFVLFDNEDRLVMSNSRYAELFPESAAAIAPGVSFEELLRHGLEQNQFGDADGREEAWLEERLSAHRDPDRVVEQPTRDGRWLRILEGPTPDGGRVGLRVDITAIKEQQAALERERERAEAASRAKSAFLANMSHEIRTPMNGVVGMADLLLDTGLTEEQRLFVETMKNSGEALLLILNDVLDFSRIEAGKMPIHADPFDLETCIHEVLLLLDPRARAKGLELALDYDIFLPTGFVGDAGRLRQVLTNLVGNAIKFTSKGHILVRVTGHDAGDATMRQVHLTVEDTGIGIPPDMAEHVFGEFNQVETARNRSFEGTGLGLAICRQLVTLMRGNLWVDSELDSGSCFGFSLPLALGDPSEQALFRPVEAKGEKTMIPGRKLHVLAAEDNRTNQLVLRKILEQFHIRLDFVSDGAEAIAVCADTRPDLVLMDISMPGMDGKEATRRIREHEAAHGLPRVPIVAMTAHAMQGDAEAILEAGLDHYLTKPLRKDALGVHIARRQRELGLPEQPEE